MNVYTDIESIPEQPEEEAKKAIAGTIKPPATMSKPETIEAWHNGGGKYAGAKDAAIEEVYRKTSFDGGRGQICSIAWAIEDDNIDSYSLEPRSEYDIIELFFDRIYYHCTAREKGGPTLVRTPFFIGHNITFDLKFLFHRAVVLGIRPPFKLPFDGRHGKDFYCTMQAWDGYRDRISQDNLCKALGIEGKPNDIDGSKVWDHFKAGNISRIAEYNRDDVAKVRRIYKRINFIENFI